MYIIVDTIKSFAQVRFHSRTSRLSFNAATLTEFWQQHPEDGISQTDCDSNHLNDSTKLPHPKWTTRAIFFKTITWWKSRSFRWEFASLSKSNYIFQDFSQHLRSTFLDASLSYLQFQITMVNTFMCCSTE